MRAGTPEGGRAPRLEALLAAHGLTALFYGGVALLASVRAGRARLALRAFDRRIVSEATLDGVSVDARVRLYFLAGLAFLAAAVAVLVALGFAERRIPERHLRALRATSAAGVALLYMRVFELELGPSLLLLVAVHALFLATGCLAGRRGAFAERVDPIAGVAWLAASAAAVLFPLFQLAGGRFSSPELVAPVLVLAVGLGLALAASRSARPEPWIHASIPLAALALVPFLRDEAYLLLNGRGIPAPPPLALQGILYAGVAAWMALRLRRARSPDFRLDLERELGRVAFPLLLVGALTLVAYRPFLDPPEDLLEPANSGLSIQQWFEFGRIPFVETFDVHGLWDGAYGFVYALLSGYPRELWGFYDFGKKALPIVLLYFFLRRATGSPYVALFAAAFLPYADELAPTYCAPALVAAFPLHRALARRSLGAYLVLFATLSLLVLWRIDIGFAAVAGALLALAAAAALVPGSDPRPGRAAAAAGLVGGAAVAGWVALCAAADVDPLARTRDLLRVLLSNQGYGHTDLAEAHNQVTAFHLYAAPVAVLLVALGSVLAWRRERRDGRVPASFACAALVFLCGYVFANVPRGLVRHSFLEPGNVYLASFSALAIGLAPYLAWRRERPLLAFGSFLALSSVLALHFPLDSPRFLAHQPARNLWHELVARLPARRAVERSEAPTERDGVPERYAERTFAELRAFLDANLTDEETFLDLSHNPMLYVYAHRVSPHWLNHLMCAPDEASQLRVIEELGRFEVPVVVFAQDEELAREAGLRWTGSELDGVPFRLRHFRLFEHVYERYRPLAQLGRWQVWTRADWGLPAPPGGESRVVLARPGDGPVELEPGRAYFLRVAGEARAPGSIRVSVRTSRAGVEERELALPSGPFARELPLALPIAPATLEELRVEPGAGDAIELARAELVERGDPVYARLARGERETEETELRLLPWLWARYDERADERRPVRVLLEPAPAGGTVVEELAVLPRDGGPWRHGVHLELAAVMLEDAAFDAGLAPGDVLELAAGGARTVREILGRQVVLDGPPLDPGADGAPHAAAWRRPALRGRLLADGERARFELDGPHAARPTTYLVLRVANRDGRARELVVEHGEAERATGRFVLALRPDRAEHEYCVRLAVHRSWWRQRGGWIAVSPSGGSVDLAGVLLAEGE